MAKDKPKPKLFLPLPLRRDRITEHVSPEEEEAKLLQTQFVQPLAGASSLAAQRVPAALRSGRQVPARLQALDDQTLMPREVYNRMLKAGDEARGRMGYGQHKLTFVGPEGLPVLKIAA